MNRMKLVAAVMMLTMVCVVPTCLQAEELIEKAGVATGVTVGNSIAVPLKAVSMIIGGLSGALSFIVTGGDTEVAKQVWRDTSQGPYLVTPELARMSVGQRPELEP